MLDIKDEKWKKLYQSFITKYGDIISFNIFKNDLTKILMFTYNKSLKILYSSVLQFEKFDTIQLYKLFPFAYNNDLIFSIESKEDKDAFILIVNPAILAQEKFLNSVLWEMCSVLKIHKVKVYYIKVDKSLNYNMITFTYEDMLNKIKIFDTIDKKTCLNSLKKGEEVIYRGESEGVFINHLDIKELW